MKTDRKPVHPRNEGQICWRDPPLFLRRFVVVEAEFEVDAGFEADAGLEQGLTSGRDFAV
jgi:hypothetical protein